MKLSVAMIVKNEEVMLGACLDSVQGADEIVVCDTGSTDKTVEIAIKYTDKVFTDYTWNDNFAEARNHAMNKCTGDWILTIDADDTLEPEGIAKIREAIAKNPNALCMNVKYQAVGGTASHNIPVLYKKCKEIFWKGAIHNHLSQTAEAHSGATTYYGHSPAHKNDPDRAFRILKKEVEKDRTKPREVYYLAREYRYRSNWTECLYWCSVYLKIAIWAPEIADTHLMRARCLWHLQRGEEARDACLQAIKYNTNFKEALLFMANMVGPVNKENWLWMAEVADNSKVLFTRDKVEKKAEYYEKIYKSTGSSKARYHELYKTVGEIIGEKSMLDIGCGQGTLSEYIKNYDGFDMVENPYCVADIYTHDFGDYDSYVLLEVLEHLTRDKDVLEKIPSGKEIVFSVPSFDDPSHVRMFTERIVQYRYADLIELNYVLRFNFNSTKNRWQLDLPGTPSYILLCRGRKI